MIIMLFINLNPRVYKLGWHAVDVPSFKPHYLNTYVYFWPMLENSIFTFLR